MTDVKPYDELRADAFIEKFAPQLRWETEDNRNAKGWVNVPIKELAYQTEQYLKSRSLEEANARMKKEIAELKTRKWWKFWK